MGKRLNNETTDELGQRISRRLIEFREASNLSIEEVAKSAKISRSGVVKMESVRSNPTLDYIDRYVRACGRTLGEFFEPWLPPGTIQYDRHIHRTISAALRDHRAKGHVYTFVEMLRQLRVG